MITRSETTPAPTIVVVGGGPIGLPHALGIKILNPQLNIVIIEKYENYQRSHTLVMEHEKLKALIAAMKAQQIPELTELLKQLKKDPHIRTQALEGILKKLAQDKGIVFQYEEAKVETLEDQLRPHQPKWILGGDGTHSVVNKSFFPKDNKVKVELDYVLQMRYEVRGDTKAQPINPASFYQIMAQRGMVANEYVGNYDSEKNKTPVTMQMMISKAAFEKLKTATSKNPIRLYSNTLPIEINGFLNAYLLQKTFYSGEDSKNIILDSVRISVNEAPVTYVKQPFILNQNRYVLLVGDAGLGLSYFKGLNAGIEAATKFFLFLGKAIKQGLTDEIMMQEGFDQYALWYNQEFAPAKIKEVESYSMFRIRTGMKAMQAAKAMQNFSQIQRMQDYEHTLEDYFNFNGQDPHIAEEFRNNHQVFPHRDYDPPQFWNFSYVPLTHTLHKMGKLLTGIFQPYKSNFQFIQDIKQPLVGIANLGIGLFKSMLGIFS